MPTLDTEELCLGASVCGCHVPAAGAGLTGVVRRLCQQRAASPLRLVFQLPPELCPSLIENGAVQPGFLPDPLTVLLACPLRTPGHVPDLHILNTDERVVFADRGSALVQEVSTGVGDLRVNLLYFAFCLLPVVAELGFAAHAPLITCQPLLVLFEAVERGNETAVAQGGQTRNANIDADGCASRWPGWLNLTLGLDAGVALATALPDGDVLGRSQNLAA